MNRIMTDRSRARQQRIIQRLDKSNFPDDLSQPMFRAANIHFEIAERAVGTPYGGIGLDPSVGENARPAGNHRRAAALVQVPPAVSRSRTTCSTLPTTPCADDGVACKIWNCDGRTKPTSTHWKLAPRIPDPTTAGDFVAAFTQDHLDALQEAIDFTRRASRLGQSARPVFRTGDSRRRWHNGRNRWRVQTGNGTFPGKASGDNHPLVISLANTGEVLRAGQSLWQPPVSLRACSRQV